MKHGRRLPFITAIGGICAFFLILIFPSLSGAQEEECANIAGTWNGSETGTTTCTVAGETETEPVNESGIVTIEQNRCDIKYRLPNFDKTGTVERNIIRVSGPLAILSGREISYTQNSFTAEGTISVGKIKLTGSGIATGTVGGEGESFPFSCTANSTSVLTRCGAETIPRPDLSTVSGHGWSMRTKVTDDDGLEIRKVTLGDRGTGSV
jgi:hypothetical protein